MTKFKDVAHLYIGCECNVSASEYYDSGTGKLVRVDIEDDETLTISGNTLHDRTQYSVEADVADVKPILRPLSDMTVDIANEILKIRDMNGIYKTECILDLVKESLMSKKWPNNFNAASKITIYLISKHFDLFGLIESGEAIDATTLTDGELESGLSGKL